MTDVVQVTGVFRDRGQARMAVAAALKKGFEAPASDTLLEDAAGVHVTVGASDNPDEARRLLLQYGAYTVSTLGGTSGYQSTRENLGGCLRGVPVLVAPKWIRRI